MYHYSPTLQFVTTRWLVMAMEQHASADAPKKANTNGRVVRDATARGWRQENTLLALCAIVASPLVWRVSTKY